MVIAGIDEAGYGPMLGPLVVGCCAFEVPDAAEGFDPAAELPCVWKRLGKLVSRSRSKNGRKIHVNDSKLVYSPGIGLKELERSVLAMLTTLRGHVDGLDAVLRHAAPQAVPDFAEYSWYAPPAGEPFPIEADGTSVRLFAKGLAELMGRTQTRLVHLEAQVICERQLNRMFDATRNKASALFSIAARHLDHLLRMHGRRNLVIYCDRQGGREHYGSLLRLMFDEWSLEITREQDGFSDYRLRRGESVVRIVFCEKAEERCLPVALASMLSKYLREALMHRFNAYWRQFCPDVAPTAGYYGDGARFLSEIDAKRRELNVPDDALIRSR
jgi:hypothetical protein